MIHDLNKIYAKPPSITTPKRQETAFITLASLKNYVRLKQMMYQVKPTYWKCTQPNLTNYNIDHNGKMQLHQVIQMLERIEDNKR